ncbi:MAG: PhzF family phenazine biosynthesis protein [Candidatus Adiutrix sp.]|jgi:predicted PhzF superfamily epimerase YddE/YHI9|nr:PhzF family phenazine biosynthesis protein [Candidatus Adiutrix sp.]
MIVKIFLINAFTDGLFSGGKAGVVILRHLGQEVFLQALAQEMALPVTAYVLPHHDAFMVRYFTPQREIESADYGALATAQALFGAGLAPDTRPVELLGRGGRRQVFRVGPRADGRLGLSLPQPKADRFSPAGESRLSATLGLAPEEVLAAFSLGSEQVLVCCRSLAGLKKVGSGLAALAALAPASRLTLSAALDIGGRPGYTVRGFDSTGELEEAPLNFEQHAILAPFWSARLAAPKMEVHHQAARPCLLWAEISPPGPVLVSGHLNTIFKADPTLSELTDDQPPELMNF